MLKKIKKSVEQELRKYATALKTQYRLNTISPLLFDHIRDFILRPGKRLRPMLFCIGYLGFAKKTSPGLYTSAISIELLHDFMLVHDDIIDKSDTRRGKPSMHKMFNNYLNRFRSLKFNGQDLAIVAADVMFAMGIDTFLAIKEDRRNKERALKQLVKAALYTGSGEFIELLCGIKELADLTKADIYKIYDYKTAYYTFSSPLAIGALLAGASDAQAEKLIKYGIWLGRAFQIKDDILGMFAGEEKIGKPNLTDLQESKKTLLIWLAYNHGNKSHRRTIKKVFSRKNIGQQELLQMRKVIRETGALEEARKEILSSLRQANLLIRRSRIKTKTKQLLNLYSSEILQ